METNELTGRPARKLHAPETAQAFRLFLTNFLCASTHGY
jgi:hypothetical protein